MAGIEDDILKKLDEAMDEIIDQIFAKSQENLVQDGKIDTGFLLKTGNVNRSFLNKTIVYPASYAEPVHFGRNPGSMPPPHALEKWVQRKLGVPAKQAKTVAFKIALSIKKRGVMPTPFLQDAVLGVMAETGG